MRMADGKLRRCSSRNAAWKEKYFLPALPKAWALTV
jgi:hypothetical protein